MIQFLWPWAFALLPLPILVRLLLPTDNQTAGMALRVPFFQALLPYSEGQKFSSRFVRSKLLFAFLIWCLLVIGASRPQWLGEPVEIPVSGRDLMMAVDVSGSMEEADMKLHGRRVSRLTVIKDVAARFIQRRVGDRLGLILFGTNAYLQTPLSYDRKTVEYMLGDAVPKIAGEKTAIGDAIGLAVKRLQKTENTDKILILLSDGANTAGEIDPRKAADLASQTGLKIYTIGIGADEMQMRGFFGMRRVNPSSELDEKMLTDVAEKTGGQYFRATDTKGLEAIYKRLDQLEPKVNDAEIFRPIKALYMWPVVLALGLTFLWMLMILLLQISGLRSDNNLKDK